MSNFGGITDSRGWTDPNKVNRLETELDSTTKKLTTLENKVSEMSEDISELEETSTAAQAAADEAKDIADATGQHFWYDTQGAHVTEATKSEFQNSAVGGNQLSNSNGILLRYGDTNIAQFSQSGVSFYDGGGNYSSNVTSSFGQNGVMLRDGDVTMELSNNQMVFRSSQVTDSNYFTLYATPNPDNSSIGSSALRCTVGSFKYLKCNGYNVITSLLPHIHIKSLTAKNISIDANSLKSGTISCAGDGAAGMYYMPLCVVGFAIKNSANNGINGSNVFINYLTYDKSNEVVRYRVCSVASSKAKVDLTVKVLVVDSETYRSFEEDEQNYDT